MQIENKMDMSEGKSSSCTENDNFLSCLYNSKEEFEKEYKNKYIKKNKVKGLYLDILSKLESSMMSDNLDGFMNFSTLIAYMTSVENREALKVYYDNPSNPIRCSNLIILASKYKQVKLVEYLFDNQGTLLNNLSVNIGRSSILPSDVDEARHNAFYYAIRSGDIILLDTLITKWPGKYFDVHLEELDDVLSKAYEDLRLNNVLLTDEIILYVEEKIIHLRIFSDNFTQVKPVKSSLENIRERIKLILENTALLRLNANEVNEKFLFLVAFIAQNIHLLKQQLKFTYDKLPWEEMEFCLISFVSSYIKQEEMNLFYHAVLNKRKILNHLENFVKQLEHEETIIEHIDVDKLSTLPKIKRDEVVKKIINSHPQFEELYNDYNQISDIYSLTKISCYSKLAISASPYLTKGHNIIMRTLQVIGEFLKNTLESPKLSRTTSELLLLSLSAESRQVILDLRDSLSHFQSLSFRIEIEEKMKINYFIIKKDIQEVESIIINILFKNKIKMIRILLEKIIDYDNVDDVKHVCEILNNAQLNKLESESLTSVGHETIQTLIEKLKNRIQTKYNSNYSAELLTEVNNIINLEIRQSENYFLNYSIAFDLLKRLHLCVNNVPVNTNVIQISKFIANKVLHYITPKINLKRHKEISDVLSNFVHSVKLETDFNIDEIKRLSCKILWIVQFEVGNIKSLVNLRDMLKIKRSCVKTEPKDIKDSKENKDKYFTTQLVSKLSMLKSILDENKMNNNSVEHFYKYMQDKDLQAAIEMLVLDIMSILGSSRNCLEDNVLFSIDFSPLLLGNVLHNYLAHDNAFFNILLSDPSLAVILNARILSAESEIITGKKTIGKPVKDDTLKLKYRFSNGLVTITNKEHMFAVAEEGNLDGLKNCLKTGADINARSVTSWTILHFAAKGCSLEVFKFILDQNLQVNANDINNQSLLHIAAAYGRENIAEFLLSEQNFYVDDVDSNGRTPLHMAAINGHVGILEILLNHKASTTIKDSYSFTPLHYAIGNSYVDIVIILLRKEQNVDANTVTGGFTPLHIASEWGYLEIVEVLLKNKSNVNAKNDKNCTSLHLAAINGGLEVFKILILNGAEVNATANDGCSPLYYAVEHGHEKIVNVLIEHGVDLNVENTYNCFTPLHIAAKYGFENIIKTLLKNKADDNIPAYGGVTPLDLATQHGHIGIVNVLLQYGTCLSLENTKYLTHLLHIAVFNNHREISELLIKYKAEVSGGSKMFLHLAIRNDSKEIVDLLIKNKAYVNAKDTEGYAPLHIAVMYGKRDVVDLLIRNKAEVDLIANNRQTPLHIASMNVQEIVEMLIQNKANINLKDIKGFTPLHVAVFFKKKDIISTFIKNHAKINIKDAKGNTPLHVALQASCKQDHEPNPDDICNGDQTQESSLGRCSWTEIVELLIQNGANINEENKFHETPILLAVSSNCEQIVKLLISNGANVTNDRLIPIAISLGNVDIVNTLVLNKAPVNTIDRNGNTPLHNAVLKGEKKIVNLLMTKGANVNAKTNVYYTPLHYAAIKGYEEIVAILIENGADVNSLAMDRKTPLHVSSHSINIVKTLLKNGAEIHRKDFKNRTAAELAASSGRLQVVKTLLEHTKVDINSKGNGGFTMLHLAVQAGSVDTTKYLVNYGADINVIDSSGLKPAHIACRDGHTKIVKYFLDVGLSVNDLGHQNQSLLHYSAFNGQRAIVEFLIKQGADINAKDIHAATPLHGAAMFGHFDVVKLLLTHGAMYDTVDCNSKKPSEISISKPIIDLLFSTDKLFEAVKSNEISVIDKVIMAVSVPNVKNANFQTPLHIATWKGYDEGVKKLLQYGANPNVVCDKKYTPLHFAAKFSHLKIVIALLSKGAIYNFVTTTGKVPLDFVTNENIRNVFELIKDSFNKLKNGNCTVINDLKIIQCTDTLQAVMNAKDEDNKTLIMCAIENNFKKIEQLKRIGQPDDIFIDIDTLCLQERYDEAITLLRAVLKRQREIFKQDRLVVVDIIVKLAGLLYAQQNYEEALKNYKEVFFLQKALLGPNHLDTLNSQNNVANLLFAQGQFRLALINYRESFEKRKAILGPNHPDILHTESIMQAINKSLNLSA